MHVALRSFQHFTDDVGGLRPEWGVAVVRRSGEAPAAALGIRSRSGPMRRDSGGFNWIALERMSLNGWKKVKRAAAT